MRGRFPCRDNLREIGANPLTGLAEPVERGERRRRLLGRNALIRRLAGRVEGSCPVA